MMLLFAKNRLLLRNRERDSTKTRHPFLPYIHVLIPDNKLNVHVFDHLVELDDGTTRSAVGYKTDGLKTLGQQEIVLILLNDERGLKRNRKSFSHSEPLDFFRQLYCIAERSHVTHGSSTKFVADRGLLGSSAILYVQMPPLHNVIEKDKDGDCLAMILLFGAEERQALSVLGHLRMLGLLGHKSCYYPFPYWSDLQRRSLFDRHNPSSRSVLAMFTGRFFLPYTSTITHHPIQKQIVLKMKKKASTSRDTDSDSSSVSEKLPRADIPTILFPGSIDDSANGLYVRETVQDCLNRVKNKKRSMFVTARGEKHAVDALAQDYVYSNTTISQDKNMACCFLALVGQDDRSSTTNSARMMEDGFFVFLSHKSWREFWENLLNRDAAADHKVILKDGMELLLMWVP